MNWTRSETIALAREACAHCGGYGLRRRTSARKLADAPCNCVLRAIFRACYDRYRSCLRKDHSGATFDPIAGRPSGVWGRKREEYIADFLLVSRRSLDPSEYGVFRYHFLMGGDWRECCQRLNLDKGIFFDCVYRIEQRLGRVFRELEPYSLFPLDQYFGMTVSPRQWPPVRSSWRAPEGRERPIRRATTVNESDCVEMQQAA